MPDRFKQFLFFVSYWLDAVDEHSLHSPFFFDFYTRVVKQKNISGGNTHYENLRNQLLKDNRKLIYKDLGSRNDGERTVSSIAKTSLSPLASSLLYARIASYFQAKSILELGTSFGINTLYLAERPEVRVTTLEGVPQIAEIAADTFAFAGASNITMVTGNIDATLGEVVQSLRSIDLVIMDANHRFEPTVSYFDKVAPRLSTNSVVIVDDIHYSVEMEKAWHSLRRHRLVYASADLYRCGVLFFDPSLNKQHVILQV